MMWADYIKERLGQECFSNERGFITFEIRDGVCVIHDLYVKPEYRLLGVARNLANSVMEYAKRKECHRIIGQVVLSANGAKEALQAHLSWGLVPTAADGGVIITMKEI